MSTHDPRRYELTWANDLRHEGRCLPFGRWLFSQFAGATPGWLLHSDEGRLVAVHVGGFDRGNDLRIAQGWANGAVAADVAGDVLIEWAQQTAFAPWIGRRWIGRASGIADVLDVDVTDSGGPVLRRLAEAWTSMVDAIAPTDAGNPVSVACLAAEAYTVVAFMLDEAGARRVVAQRDALAARVGAPLEVHRTGTILRICVRDPRVVWLLAQDAPLPAGDPAVLEFPQVLVVPTQVRRSPALAGGAR